MNMTTFALPSSNTSCLLPPTKLYERRAKHGGINVFIITRRRRWEWRAKYHRTRLMATWVAAATMFLLKYSIYLVTIWFRQHLIRTSRYGTASHHQRRRRCIDFSPGFSRLVIRPAVKWRRQGELEGFLTFMSKVPWRCVMWRCWLSPVSRQYLHVNIMVQVHTEQHRLTEYSC